MSTEPTTVPTAAVFTHVLHLLMNLLMYVPTVPTVRARTIPTVVQYVVRTDIRMNCTADVRTYIYTRALRGGPLRGGPLWRPAASLVGHMRCQVL